MTAAARILTALAAATTPMTQGDLARELDVNRSTISRALGTLVAAGEVEKVEQADATAAHFQLPAIVEEITAIAVDDVEMIAALARGLEAGTLVTFEDAFAEEIAADQAAAIAAGACEDCYAEAGDPCQPYCSRSTIEAVPVAPKAAKRVTKTSAAPARVLAALAAADRPLSRVELATSLGFCRNIATRALAALIASGEVVRTEQPGNAPDLHALRAPVGELVGAGA